MSFLPKSSPLVLVLHIHNISGLYRDGEAQPQLLTVAMSAGKDKALGGLEESSVGTCATISSSLVAAPNSSASGTNVWRSGVKNFVSFEVFFDTKIKQATTFFKLEIL